MEQTQPGESSASVVHGAQQMGEQLERSAAQLEDAAVERVHMFRSKLESGLETERGQAVDRMHRVGQALRVASDQVGPEDRAVHDALDYVSERAEDVAAYISQASFAEMRRDASDFVRRRPGLVFGGAVLLGITAGRLLKAEAALEARPPERRHLGQTRWQEEPEEGGRHELR